MRLNIPLLVILLPDVPKIGDLFPVSGSQVKHVMVEWGDAQGHYTWRREWHLDSLAAYVAHVGPEAKVE